MPYFFEISVRHLGRLLWCFALEEALSRSWLTLKCLGAGPEALSDQGSGISSLGLRFQIATSQKGASDTQPPSYYIYNILSIEYVRNPMPKPGSPIDESSLTPLVNTHYYRTPSS